MFAHSISQKIQGFGNFMCGISKKEDSYFLYLKII